MASLNPLVCSVKGCDYQTPSEANDDLKDQLEHLKDQSEHLNSHIEAAHPENPAPALEESESSGRPEAWEDMWSWQWEEFQLGWEKYKEEKKLSGEKLIEELWQCMTKMLMMRVSQRYGFPRNEVAMLGLQRCKKH